MAEHFEAFRRFDYRLNSNLVIQKDAPVSNSNEPTGEPESLAGRKLYPMGDKVVRSRMSQVHEQLAKSKTEASLQRRTASSFNPKAAREFKKTIKKGESILETDLANLGNYQPSTQETSLIYEHLLNEIISLLPNQPDDVTLDAAEEIISACRAPDLKEIQKKKFCEEILGPIPMKQFTQILQLTKGLHDYGEQADSTAETEVQSSGITDATGVAVVFDEDDEQSKLVELGSELLADQEEDDGYDDEDVDVTAIQTDPNRPDSASAALDPSEQSISVVPMAQDSDDEDFDKRDNQLNVRVIDSHWLQRELSNFFGDPEDVIAIEKEILKALTLEDLQECENRLVYLLKYDNFNFAKLLLQNRWRVYYCTRLGQAQGKQEADAILEQMVETVQGQEVLEELKSVRLRVNKEKEFARNVRREAAILAERSSQSAQKPDQLLLDPSAVGAAFFQDAQGKTKGAMMDSARSMSTAPSSTAETHVADDETDHGLKPSTLLSLEAMAFSDGERFMANASVKLTDNSQRIEKKEYDEVILPPLPRSSLTNLMTDDDAPASEGHLSKHPGSDACLSIEELPEWCRSPFEVANIKKLNAIQSTVFPVAFHQHEKNMLICAPTGAGKTNIAVLAILGLMQKYYDPATGLIDKKGFRVVYLSPIKALVAEQVAAFQKRFASYELRVEELTGDTNMTRQQIEETQIIVATPEKWDVVTRKSGEKAYTRLVQLVIIDEVHMLHDLRGPVIEALVARILIQIESTQEHTRLVALSATLPNYMDVAIFLRVSLKENDGLYVFGQHYRPVPLMQTYIGLKEKKALKRVATMNQVTYDKVLENAGKNQVLVFVHSRKETIRTAKMLKQAATDEETLTRFLQEDSASREILLTEAEALKTQELKDLLPYGFAVHHAGLPRTDRRLIEDLFADRHIQVLVSTATLAWGVNLPAHTVIIKGTQVYSPEKGKWTELSPLDVMQMMGRAGRPQYDTSGHGIIITNHSELQFYLSLNNQQLPIESQLLSSLPDYLNAEIAAGTLATRKDAVDWLGYTYLYVRLLRNPAIYGLPEDTRREGDPALSQARTDIAHAALLSLDKHQLIRYERRSGIFQPTVLGRIASHYYIRAPSLAVYNESLRPTFSDIELLRLFSLSHEFKYIPVREDEKVELSKLLERIPIPVKGSTSASGSINDDSSTKVNVLLQAYISKLKLDGFALAADMVYIQQNAGRIMRALFDIALRRGWANVARRALLFSCMIKAQMWSTMSPLRQFPGVFPEDVIIKLEKKDIPWERYYDLSASDLGELVRQPKLGKLIHRYIHSIPKLDISAYIQPMTRSTLIIEVSIVVDFRWDVKFHDPSGEIFWIFVEDGDGDLILHHEQIVLKQYQAQQQDFEMLLEFAVPITEPMSPNYFLRCISDRWIHSETSLPISFKDLILPDKNLPPTELLDLQPLPVTTLKYSPAEIVYFSQNMKYFNPVETQVLPSFYHSAENVLVCAPSHPRHLSVCAELAIWHMLQHETVHKAVYMTFYKSCAEQQAAYWTQLFKSNLSIGLLTGSINHDLALLAEKQLVVTTAEHWNAVSIRWRTRPVLQTIRLFIVDHLELLDSRDGSDIEVCISRMRYISAQLQNPIRFIGLAIPLANAHDVASWLGVESACVYNFANSRSDLRVYVEGFDTYNQTSRLQEMQKPSFGWIKRTCWTGQQAAIVVSDRKQARTTAVTLLLHATADNKPRFFARQISEETPLVFPPDLPLEKTAQKTLNLGVGYLHEGMTDAVIQYVLQLYEAGQLQAIVITEKMCWAVQLIAYLVIVQDTAKFDAKTKKWTNYPMVDIFRMMSFCQSQTASKISGVFLMMCPQSVHSFYSKFKTESLPLESSLDKNLTDNLNAEIAIKTIESKQDAVDWLTWTFYYRRLVKNPNFYGLQGVSATHLSEHLSKVVENATEALASSQCIEIDPDDEVTLTSLNSGLIAAFYRVQYVTLDLFNRSLTAQMKRKALMEVLCAAAEFTENVHIRAGEEKFLSGLAKDVGVKLSQSESGSTDVTDPNIKALLLLYAHMQRCPLTIDLQYDQRFVVALAVRLLYALIDVMSSNAWLESAIIAMELCQCVVQALMPTDSSLLQLPFVGPALVEKATKFQVVEVLDLINAEEDVRNQILADLSPNQIEKIAQACNRYPILDVDFSIPNATQDTSLKPDAAQMTDDDDEESVRAYRDVSAGATVQLVVNLERSADSDDTSPVIAPYYPIIKEEQWWVVVGHADSQTLAGLKRVVMNKSQTSVKLNIELPEKPGTQNYVLNVICDSYIGCDQQFQFTIVTSA